MNVLEAGELITEHCEPILVGIKELFSFKGGGRAKIGFNDRTFRYRSFYKNGCEIIIEASLCLQDAYLNILVSHIEIVRDKNTQMINTVSGLESLFRAIKIVNFTPSEQDAA